MAAQEVIGERGLENISMRDIADKLEISVGNLTYHFKKKEDLIEAVVVEVRKQISFPPMPLNLRELNDFFRFALTIQQKNWYYLQNFTHLSQVSQKVHELQINTYQSIFSSLQSSFHYMQLQGIVKKEELEGQLDHLAQAILMITLYWVSQSNLAQGGGFADTPLQVSWSLIYPFLTEAGQDIFQKEILPSISAIN